MVPLTGVLAGFMFSAIVVIITVNRPTGTGRTEAFFALRLQVIAGSPEVLRLLIGAAYFVLFGRLIGALLSANSYVSDVLPRSHLVLHTATWIASALAVTPTLLLAARSRRPQAWGARITACSRAAITYLVLSFVGFDLVAATEVAHWSAPTKPLVYLCGALTLLPALLLFPFIFRSIPNPDPSGC